MKKIEDYQTKLYFNESSPNVYIKITDYQAVIKDLIYEKNLFNESIETIMENLICFLKPYDLTFDHPLSLQMNLERFINENKECFINNTYIKNI